MEGGIMSLLIRNLNKSFKDVVVLRDFEGYFSRRHHYLYAGAFRVAEKLLC